MKCVALDIGNVLVNVDFQPFINKLSRSLNISVEEATYFMNRSQKLHDLGLTIMRDELIDHLKIKSSVLRDDLIEEWNLSIKPADWMLDKLDDLYSNFDLKIALLSNIGLEHSMRIREIFKYNKFFDDSIKYFSCEVGVRKPTFLYYQSFLQMYPEWQGAPYVDDLQENLDVASRFRFKTFRFSLQEITGTNYQEETFNKIMQDLEKFLLEP